MLDTIWARGRIVLARRLRLLAVVGAALAAVVFIPAASGVGGAAFTSINEAVDDTGHCQNSAINCNIYDSKQFVWLNGGPQANGLKPDGQYFFAVLVPGGQPDPNDSAAKNLSDDYDAYTDRTFTVSGGEVSAYGGPHDLDSGAGTAGSRLNTPDDSPPLIRLAPYADTTNPGGVYILAICYLGPSGTSYPVDPRDCKYDAFKVKESETEGPFPLTVLKDADGTFDRIYHWTIQKDVDKTIVQLIGGGSATFNYTVGVTHDGGTDSNWLVSGTITVFNPNAADVTGVDVTDSVDNGGSCTVTSGTSATIPALDSVSFAYSCSYGSAPGNGTNTGTATWPDQTLTTGDLAGDSADFIVPFTFPTDPTNVTDECVTVTDSYAGNLGNACVADANPKTFTYSRTISAPIVGTCVPYNNTATFTTNDTGATNSDSETVTVCNYNAALTPGYWKNHLTLDRKHPNDPYTAKFLPKSLGGYVVDSTVKATAVFNAMNCSNTGSNAQLNQNAIGCLAGHLLAAKLNLANNSDPCIAATVAAADTFLSGIPYTGPTGNYTGIGTVKRNQAITLKNALDKYNNGGGC